MERTVVSDEEIAIGEDCKIDSQTTSSEKHLNCTQLFANTFYHELKQNNLNKFWNRFIWTLSDLVNANFHRHQLII